MSIFFFSSRRRHTRLQGDWSSDVCSSDLFGGGKKSVRPCDRVFARGSLRPPNPCTIDGMISVRFLALHCLAAAAVLLAQTGADDKDKDKKKEEQGMQYRAIGPFRGGRSLTASGVPGDPTTYYFGATGGGVWKSTDGATTWKPVFDREKSSSIGSLAVAPSDPNIVYAGTGEGCIRGNAATGDGVYKSVDAGKTWKNVGLRDSRAIGKLIVDPRDPDTVFVAALGHPY